jgi:DNA-binding NarL/FixJ family response regulator
VDPPGLDRNEANLGTVVYRTLLADDVFDLRFMVKLALERSGRFEVVAEAENGQEAIEMTREHKPDLVLLDISMPVLDGLEALPQVLEVCDACRVVMLSGFESARIGSTALDLGAAAYLEKGISPGELVSALLEVMDGQAA